MDTARPSRRLLAMITLMLVALGSATASARPPAYKREVKKIKKALVRVEFDIDDATAERMSLTKQLPSVADEITLAGQELDVAAASQESGAFPPFDVASAAIRLTNAVSWEAGAEARIDELAQTVQFLVAERTARIDELQRVVQRRLRAQDKTSSLSLGGTLVTYSADWEAVAMCESSGNWNINSQFDGGLQFHPLTWLGFGGAEFSRYAYQATKTQQIAVAERVLAIQGPGAWPNCFHPLPFGF